ncbi:hypothetical protein BG842_00930 [Haladaptatus sp. W1]|uniref:hypothetical protein n=1 Tax=Haladaptatus sp. W1 TaxID=1897478 RepID=UPI0008497635|nr:hypothetical protein [Haladaptatus sp. W1]ODR82310.1 hypothetical protein BG842_00930 [Haladaptatus sp. W1]
MTETETSGNSETETNGWTTDRRHGSVYRRRLAFLGKSVTVGVIGGMAAFTYSLADLMAVSIDPVFVLVPLALSGVFAHLVAYDLHESIRVGLVGFFVGAITLVGSWVAPLWLLPYTSGARDILLPKLTGTAVVAAIIVYGAVYLGAYLSALTVGAYVST